MGDEIGLEEPGRRIIPIGVGADRHSAPDRRRWRRAAATATAGLLAHRPKNPVDRGGADCFQPLAHSGIEDQVPMALQRRDQHRDERLQSLAANSVRRFPQYDQRLPEGVIVKPPIRPRL